MGLGVGQHAHRGPVRSVAGKDRPLAGRQADRGHSRRRIRNVKLPRAVGVLDEKDEALAGSHGREVDHSRVRPSGVQKLNLGVLRRQGFGPRQGFGVETEAEPHSVGRVNRNSLIEKCLSPCGLLRNAGGVQVAQGRCWRGELVVPGHVHLLKVGGRIPTLHSTVRRTLEAPPL